MSNSIALQCILKFVFTQFTLIRVSCPGFEFSASTDLVCYAVTTLLKRIACVPVPYTLTCIDCAIISNFLSNKTYTRKNLTSCITSLPTSRQHVVSHCLSQVVNKFGTSC